MNSWGSDFGDDGFFRVRNQSVLNLKFYDVYWTLKDLKQSEIDAYNQKKRRVGEDILNVLPNHIKQLPYKCPKCKKSSPANQFIGHIFTEATCPECKQAFAPTFMGLVV